jgi:putative methyltransferase (TIGR04325 family)
MLSKLVRKVWRLFGRVQVEDFRSNDVRFDGDYSCWLDALQFAGKYDDELILERVLAAVMDVKDGRAAFERDSVTFEQIEYNWPLLGSLMWIAASQGGKLSVVDFGGSLGSAYFQHKTPLSTLESVSWAVVEQPKFVSVGRQSVEEKGLRFYYRIEDVFSEANPTILLLGSVLQYLPSPWDYLDSLLRYPFEYVILDRTAFLVDRDIDRLTIQTVPPTIYAATYPAWFLSKKRLRAAFVHAYEEIAHWKNSDSYRISGDVTSFEGFMFFRRGAVTR